MEERKNNDNLEGYGKIVLTGPIPVTETSHPFSAMAYSRLAADVADYGYVEEEYFVDGKAHVYQLDRQNMLTIRERALPYKTRILIRRPINENERKPRVFLDIMNATNGYDIEDQWRRSWQYIMEHKYSYIGITSKPINALALKYFDYERYHTLNWSGSKPTTAAPAVPDLFHRIEDCEEGLIWDMLTQLGTWVKRGGKGLFTEEDKVYLYLTGQSQSGMYLNTYVNQFHSHLKREGEPVFDGYLSLVSGGLQRSLYQTSGDDCFMGVRDYPEHPVDVPFISMNTEGDYNLFSGLSKTGLRVGTNSDTDDKRRYYEVPGAPHTDAASPLVPVNEEITKCKCPKRILDGEYTYRLNDFPLDFYINGLLEKLHLWSSEGTAPECQPLMEKNADGTLKKDLWGNAMGGFRSVFLEVPKASYTGSIGPGETNGTMTYFDSKTMDTLYGSKAHYLELFKALAMKELELGHVVQSDFDRMMEWADKINQ